MQRDIKCSSCGFIKDSTSDITDLLCDECKKKQELYEKLNDLDELLSKKQGEIE